VRSIVRTKQAYEGARKGRVRIRPHRIKVASIRLTSERAASTRNVAIQKAKKGSGALAFVIEGLIVGIFLGLALRPVLDAYVLWRYMRELDEESRRSVDA
jgi:hypothetical protein